MRMGLILWLTLLLGILLGMLITLPARKVHYKTHIVYSTTTTKPSMMRTASSASEIELIAAIEELGLMLGECVGRLEARHNDIESLNREVRRLESLASNRLLTIHYTYPHGTTIGYDRLFGSFGVGARVGLFFDPLKPFLSAGLTIPIGDLQ